jgi:hypothetical protein
MAALFSGGLESAREPGTSRFSVSGVADILGLQQQDLAGLTGVHFTLPLAVHPRFDQQSFELNLDRLLARKRDLSAKVLVPPVASDGDLAGLAADTLGR